MIVCWCYSFSLVIVQRFVCGYIGGFGTVVWLVLFIVLLGLLGGS